MGFSIDFKQSAHADMGIFLGSRKAFMAQTFLYDTQVSPGIKHMGRETMPQGMGADGRRKPGLPDPCLETPGHSAVAETPTQTIQKNRLRIPDS